MAIGILAAASLLLCQRACPRPQFAPAARAGHGTPLASGHAADLLVDVSAAPNRPGQNFVTATVLDTLRPRRARCATSRSRSRVDARGSRCLRPGSTPTHWQVAGTQLSGPGDWRIAVAAERACTATCHLGDLLDRRLGARRGARAQGAVLAARPRADHDAARARPGSARMRHGDLARPCPAHPAAAADRVMRTALLMALAGAALLPAPASAATHEVADRASRPGGRAGRSRDAARGRRPPRAERPRAQAPLLAELAALQRAGHVRHVRSLWIAGAVAVTADAEAIAALSARPDVRSIESDSVLPIHPADAITGEPGVAAAGAPELWSHGIDGRGVTVAALDTGVDLTHAELSGRYRGGGNSWFDPFGQHADPADLNGHGTQVMGIMVAGDGIGMAPGARFIAARVFNDSGASTDSGVHLAFQWLLDPDGNPATDDAPDVVNASWGALLAELRHRRSSPTCRRCAPRTSCRCSPPATAVPLRPRTRRPGICPRPSRSVRRRPTPRSPRSRASAPRAAAAQFPSLVAAGTGIRSTEPLRPRRHRSRRDVVRGSARRGRRSRCCCSSRRS